MKTEFMAAAAAWWLKARASARACLESKRNPYRLFRTAAAAIAVAVVIVPATILLGEGAFAHGDNAGSGYQGSWHYGHTCKSEYQISHSDTGCMHAWWDNTPPASTGKSGGSTYGAQNKCANYGAMKATIDLESGRDEHFHMSNGDKKRGSDPYVDIKDIACCLNQSDLCWKWSVEPQNGEIKRWTGTNANFEWVDVSTHAARYSYCGEYPNDIYCEIDPSHDAFTVPATTQCGPEGNRRECVASDCNTAFNNADNNLSYCSLNGYNYASSDQTCTLFSTCVFTNNQGQTISKYQADLEINLHDIKEKLMVCGNSSGYYLHDWATPTRVSDVGMG